MRVAFLNRIKSGGSGGDLIRIEETVKALREIGIEADDLDWPDRERVKDYDIAHINHVNFAWSWENYQLVTKLGMPYVVTPLFYPMPDMGATPEQVRQILAGARKIMPFSFTEAFEIAFACPFAVGESTPPGRVRVIPNGTDPSFHWPNVTEDVSGDRREVLAVVARPPDKNTDGVRWACEHIGLPFREVTGVPHDELPALYRQARVFVNASDSERMSLTIGEALCAGCRVIATTGNRGNEWYPGIVTFKAEDWWSELPRLIHRAYCEGDWDYTPNAAARLLTWQNVAQQLAEVYAEVYTECLA